MTTSWWLDGPATRVSRVPGRIHAWDWRPFEGRRGDAARSGATPAATEARIDAAFRKGFEEGVREGAAEAEGRMGIPLEAVRKAVARMEEMAEERREAAEERIRVLALAVSRLLLDRELRQEPAEITRLVRTALTHFPSEVPLRVRLNPEDLSALVHPPEGEVAPPPLGHGGTLRWEADPELGRGDVLVEAPAQILDGRVVVCLERIWEALSHD